MLVNKKMKNSVLNSVLYLFQALFCKLNFLFLNNSVGI